MVAELVNGMLPEKLNPKSGPIPVMNLLLRVIVAVTAGGCPDGAVLVTVAPVRPAFARMSFPFVITAESFAVRHAMVTASLTASRPAWFIVFTVNQARPNSNIPTARSRNRGTANAISTMLEPAVPQIPDTWLPGFCIEMAQLSNLSL